MLTINSSVEGEARYPFEGFVNDSEEPLFFGWYLGSRGGWESENKNEIVEKYSTIFTFNFSRDIVTGVFQIDSEGAGSDTNDRLEHNDKIKGR